MGAGHIPATPPLLQRGVVAADETIDRRDDRSIQSRIDRFDNQPRHIQRLWSKVALKAFVAPGELWACGVRLVERIKYRTPSRVHGSQIDHWRAGRPGNVRILIKVYGAGRAWADVGSLRAGFREDQHLRGH